MEAFMEAYIVSMEASTAFFVEGSIRFNENSGSFHIAGGTFHDRFHVLPS